MTVALSVAVGQGAEAVVCASHRQHLRVDGGLRRAGQGQAARARAAGQDRRRQARPGDPARRPGDHGPRQLRRLPADLARARRALPGRAGQLGQPDAPRRARRPPPSRSSTSSATPPTCTCCRPATPATSRRTGWATARPTRPATRPGCRVMRGWQAAGAAPLVLGAPVPDPETVASAIRIGNPASWDLAVGRGRPVGRQVPAGHRRRDPRRPARARRPRRRLRRARLRRRRRRAAARGLPRASGTPASRSWSP